MESHIADQQETGSGDITCPTCGALLFNDYPASGDESDAVSSASTSSPKRGGRSQRQSTESKSRHSKKNKPTGKGYDINGVYPQANKGQSATFLYQDDRDRICSAVTPSAKMTVLMDVIGVWQKNYPDDKILGKSSFFSYICGFTDSHASLHPVCDDWTNYWPDARERGHQVSLLFWLYDQARERRRCRRLPEHEEEHIHYGLFCPLRPPTLATMTLT